MNPTNQLMISTIDTNLLLQHLINNITSSINLNSFGINNPILTNNFNMYWFEIYSISILNRFVYNYPIYNYSIPLQLTDDLYLQTSAIVSSWNPLILKLLNEFINWTINFLKSNGLTLTDYQAFFSRSAKSNGTTSGMNANSYNTTTSSAALTLNANPTTLENIEDFSGNQNQNQSSQNDFVFLDMMSQLNSIEMKTVKIEDFVKTLQPLLIRSW